MKREPVMKQLLLALTFLPALLSAATIVLDYNSIDPISEAGGTVDISVSLSETPGTTSTEHIIISTDSTQADLNQTGLDFNDSTWNIPQTIRVTAKEDQIAEGDHVLSVSFVDGNISPVSYATNNATVTIADNDTAGVTINGTDTTTSEDGATGTISVVLTTQPTANVIITATSLDSGEGTVSAPLTFTTANWNTTQYFTVTGADDALIDGNQNYDISFSASTSADPVYAALDLSGSNVTMNNADNDAAGLSVTATPTNMNEGDSIDINVSLSSQPSNSVTVVVSSSLTTQAAFSGDPVTLVIAPADWNQPNKVTLNAVAESIGTGPGAGISV